MYQISILFWLLSTIPLHEYTKIYFTVYHLIDIEFISGFLLLLIKLLKHSHASRVYHFSFPPATLESDSCSMSLGILWIFWVLFGHYSLYYNETVISLCGFNLPFPMTNDPSFCMCLFASLLRWSVCLKLSFFLFFYSFYFKPDCLSYCVLREVIIHSGNKYLFRYVFCKYFFLSLWHLFSFLLVFLKNRKFKF